jgi:hypothetical protein
MFFRILLRLTFGRSKARQCKAHVMIAHVKMNMENGIVMPLVHAVPIL